VNGEKVTDLGVKVSVRDDVRYKNKRISAEKMVYILLNKPKGFVTTVEDPHADKTVLDLVGNACTERISLSAGSTRRQQAFFFLQTMASLRESLLIRNT
jgi:16S rRNA U516 pseudouridylate synthase RsuA-like enzyme